MQGWRDVAYFRQWVEAVRTSEIEAAKSPGLVTRVIRKPHDFRPPEVCSTELNAPEDYIENYVTPELPEDEDWEALRLLRKHQKKQARAVSARARIPTWYDRISDDDY